MVSGRLTSPKDHSEDAYQPVRDDYYEREDDFGYQADDDFAAAGGFTFVTRE